MFVEIDKLTLKSDSTR